MTAPSLPQPSTPQGEISLRVLAMPADSNQVGKIFGGWVMSQMDMAGAMHAHGLTRQRLVTVAVESMKFHRPIEIGDEVTCYTRTGRIGRTSITVLIETWVRNPSSPMPVHVTSGTFIFVTVDDEGRPTPIQPAR